MSSPSMSTTASDDDEDLHRTLNIIRLAVNQKLREERMVAIMEEARQIQNSILPRHLPKPGDFEIAARERRRRDRRRRFLRRHRPRRRGLRRGDRRRHRPRSAGRPPGARRFHRSPDGVCRASSSSPAPSNGSTTSSTAAGSPPSSSRWSWSSSTSPARSSTATRDTRGRF